MGDVFWGVHLPLASLVSQSGVRCAVETGTFFGSGCLHLSTLFERVWTIEQSEPLTKMCKSLYGHVGNIEFVNASASEGLKLVLEGISESAFFFLDAHWFPSPALLSDASPSPPLQCELIEEIYSISSFQTARDGSIIVIDDADMFLGSLPPEFDDNQFPSISKILKTLDTTFEADVIEVIDDVIFASSARNSFIMEDYKKIRGSFGRPGFKKIRC